MPTTHVQGKGRVRALAAGLALASALSMAPAAAADTTPIAPTGSGLTAPAGIVRDSAGAIWVADALRGICKLNPALPGASVVVADGTWCDSGTAVAVAGAPVTRPAAPFQMGYDAASSSLFVAEGSSHSSGVWRLHIDPATSTITAGKKIVFEGDRVFGLALGTDAAGHTVVDYTTKRSPLIHRVPDAVTCDPCSPFIAGTAQTAGAPSLANLDGTLYIAEVGVVTRLANPGPTGGVAQPVAGFPGGVANALAVDRARGRVYAGTLNGNNQDQVDVLTPSNGAVETYATNLAGVTALAVSPDGALLVGDDPAHGAGTAGSGQVLSVSLGTLGTPRATITGGPQSFTQSHAVAFSFSGPIGSTFECRLDPAGPATPWVPCGTGPTGSFGAPSLGEGVHAFEVRAVSPDPAIGAGAAQRRTFVVDGTAPHVSIDNSPADQVLTGVNGLTLRFSSNDGAAAFACSLDGQPATPCSDPKRYTDLLVGEHVFAVTATDAAGNASAPVTFRFTVLSAPATTPAPAADSRTTPGKSSVTPAGPAGAVAHLSAELRPVSVRLVRQRTTLGKLRSRRRIVVRIKAPALARAATVALWAGAKGTVPLAQSSLRLIGHGTQHVVLTLTTGQAKRLRTGSYLVGVTLGDGADLYGPARFRRLGVVR
jgi:hypothetical protein